MSKRGNGLSAPSYAPLADLVPQLADAMLDALRDAGIAAYAVPAPGRSGVFLDTRLPAEPTDRLYVDAAESDLAESVLEAQLPRLTDEFEHGRARHDLDGDGPSGHESAGPDSAGPDSTGSDSGGTEAAGAEFAGSGRAGSERPGPDTATRGAASRDPAERDEEAIFAEIVAAYDNPAEVEPRWPEQENLDEPPSTDKDGPERPTVIRVVKPAERRPSGGDPDDGLPAGPTDDTEPDSETEDDEGHFVPPAPPPLPPADPVTKAAWLGLFGGPLYLLIAAMLSWEVPGWTAFTAVAAFVGGFVTLVVRMGDEPRGSGPDDGAIV